MKKNILYAFISAIILWLAWPPLPFASPLLLIGFLPLLVAIENIHSSDLKNKGRKVFLLSGLTFLVWNTSCIYWIWNASPEGAVVAYLLGALLMTLSFFFYYKMKLMTKPWIADISLIGFWISYEYLHQSWDLNFPWMTLGNGFAATPHLIQWYEYTGVYGGSLWVLGSNLLLLAIWRRLHQGINNNRKTTYKLLTIMGLWILIPLIFSILTYTNYEEEQNPANIVVVQPNVDPYAKYNIPVKQHLDHLIGLSQKAIQPNTEFILWPETALPEYVNEDKIREGNVFHELQNFMSGHPNTTLITGAETIQTYQTAKTSTAKEDKNSRLYWDSFNTAIAIESSSKVQFHHKSKLVPGVEKIPFATLSFLQPVFAKFGGTTGGYGYQSEPTVLYSRNGVGVAPVICYESIWGDWMTKYIKKEAQFIGIITNDGWWGNTSGKDQHLHYARLRAIETRRWIARSANTGISAFINQRGDIVQQTEWWKEGYLNQDINLNSELTFYVKHPDILVYPFLLIGITGIFYLVIFRFRKKQRNASSLSVSSE